MPIKRPRISCLKPRLTALDTRSVRPAPKQTDAVFSDPRYKPWANAVKDRAGWRCEDCGASGCRLYADHVVERRDGGAPFDPGNGRCRCASCHSKKTAQARAARMRS